MLYRARYCYGNTSVCLVSNVEVSLSHRLEFFENNFMSDYPGLSCLYRPQLHHLLQMEQPEILAGTGMWYGKVALAYVISLKRGEIGPRLCALSIRAKINDLGWPSSLVMHSVSKHILISELTTKNWTIGDQHFHNIKVYSGVPWRGVAKRQWANENMAFQGVQNCTVNSTQNCWRLSETNRVVAHFGSNFLKISRILE